VTAVTLKRYRDAAISNATINVRVRYGYSAHVGDGCRHSKLRLNHCR